MADGTNFSQWFPPSTSDLPNRHSYPIQKPQNQNRPECQRFSAAPISAAKGQYIDDDSSYYAAPIFSNPPKPPLPPKTDIGSNNSSFASGPNPSGSLLLPRKGKRKRYDFVCSKHNNSPSKIL